MLPEYKNINQKFNEEIWLYISGELSPDRMKYWDKTLKSFPELYNEYIELSKLESISANALNTELDDSLYITLVDKSFAKQKTFSLKRIGEFFIGLFNSENFAVRFSLVTAISAVAFLIFFQTITYKKVNNELLQWNDPVNRLRISEIEISLDELISSTTANSISGNEQSLRDIRDRIRLLKESTTRSQSGKRIENTNYYNGEYYE